MTLARGNIRGYEYDRMVLTFSMMDGGREIPCAVSASAMDDLEHVSRTAPEQREDQFLRLRDRIEQCASRKLTAREFEGNPAGLDYHPDILGRIRQVIFEGRHGIAGDLANLMLY